MRATVAAVRGTAQESPENSAQKVFGEPNALFMIQGTCQQMLRPVPTMPKIDSRP